MSAAGASRISACRTASGYMVSVEGNGTFSESHAFHQFVSQCHDGDKLSLVVDLQKCRYLDSTFLGCLVSLHRRYRDLTSGQFAIVASDERIEALLKPTQLHKLLAIIDTPPEAIGQSVTISTQSTGAGDLGRHIMECHRLLCEIEGPCQEAFRRVAEQLAREFGADRLA